MSLTCCRARCLVSRCGQPARGDSWPRHTHSGPTSACSRARTAPPTGWWSLSGSSGSGIILCIIYYLQFVVTPNIDWVHGEFSLCMKTVMMFQLLAGISNFKGNEVKLHVKIWINLKFWRNCIWETDVSEVSQYNLFNLSIIKIWQISFVFYCWQKIWISI